MTADLLQLVSDAAALTGTAPPAVLDADAPTLAQARAHTAPAALYFVGVIGGKDVGKSSLVNALAGAAIADVSASGPGTEHVLAYAHRSRVDEVQSILRADVDPGTRVFAHDLDPL